MYPHTGRIDHNESAIKNVNVALLNKGN